MKNFLYSQYLMVSFLVFFCFSTSMLRADTYFSSIEAALEEYSCTQENPFTAYDVERYFSVPPPPTGAFGSAAVYNDGTTYSQQIVALSSTKFVVAYRDAGNSNYGTAIIGTVSGTTISYGSEYVFNEATTLNNSATMLSSTKFVVAYRDTGNSSYGTAIIGTVSGTTISYGSEYVFNAGNSQNNSAATLSSTSFVVAFRDNDNSSGTAIIGTVSGTTISYGSEYVFNAGTTPYHSTAALSSTSFVVAYVDDGNSSYGTAIKGTVSGTTISYSPEAVFNAAITSAVSVATLSSFVVAYSDVGNSYYGTAIHGDESALPVELTYFEAQKRDASVVLNWQTVAELNNKGFYIERSSTGRDWETIGFVNGHGNSLKVRQYEYLDSSPLAGISYYRLLQADRDGKTEASHMVSVSFDQQEKWTMRVVPNPVRDGQLSLHLNSPETTNARVLLYDGLGRLVAQKNLQLEQGGREYPVNWGQLATGLYFIRVEAGAARFLTERVLMK